MTSHGPEMARGGLVDPGAVPMRAGESHWPRLRSQSHSRKHPMPSSSQSSGVNVTTTRRGS